MNGDLSRVTFDPLKHFTRVVMQQGRVQLDADWNEQVAILLHYLQTLAADLIGPYGGPADIVAANGQLMSRNCGFAIIGAAKAAAGVSFFPQAALITAKEQERLRNLVNQQSPQWVMTQGHFYVDGILCENEDYPTYLDQPEIKNEALSNGVFHLLYLDVWERHISALEDPAISDVALGGADTAARTKVVWQVRSIDAAKLKAASITIDANTQCGTFEPSWPAVKELLQSPNRGQLRAEARPATQDDSLEPCAITPDARYRGQENQLYRVEIHRGGAAFINGSNADQAATFKWSRENATVVAPLQKVNGDTLIVSGMRDSSRWFNAGDWVELTHDGLELRGQSGIMARLAKVDGEILTISAKFGNLFDLNGNDKPRNPKVRRWDHKEIADTQNPDETKLNQGALLIQESNQNWIELEDGIQIQFQPLANGQHKYRTGDYWLIPARVATGDVEWPVNAAGESTFLPPAGIEHHYAPLGVIAVDAGGMTIRDLRHKFPAAGKC